MWNLAKTCAIVTVCLAVAGVASAADSSASLWSRTRKAQMAANHLPSAVDMSVPFVSMTVTNDPLDLGEVLGPGVHRVHSKATVHVVANCPYHIEASFEGLRNGSGGKVISPQHLTVAVNGKEMPIGTGRVTIAQSSRPTTSAGEDVPVDLQVGFLGLPTYPAGQYHGALVLTVMIGP
jgi:hypothetical protein